MKKKILKLINKLGNKLNIRPDLILHFLVSLFLIIFSGLFLKSLTLSFILTIAVGIGKEIYDMFKKNATGFDLLDLIADFCGAGIGCIILTIMFKLCLL